MTEFEYKGKIFTFTEKLLKENEVMCLKVLGYNADTTTVYDFLRYFLSIGVIFTDDYVNVKNDDGEIERKSIENVSGNVVGTALGKGTGSGYTQTSINFSKGNFNSSMSLFKANVKKNSGINSNGNNQGSSFNVNTSTSSLTEKISALVVNILDVVIDGKQ